MLGTPTSLGMTADANSSCALAKLRLLELRTLRAAPVCPGERQCILAACLRRVRQIFPRAP